jgi:regulator of nonsense transcripts 3
MIVVASTERPSMPTSTPLLDTPKTEKYVQQDKGAIQRNHSHYKDAAQTSMKDDSKKKAATTSVLLSRRNEAAIRPHFLINGL